MQIFILSQENIRIIILTSSLKKFFSNNQNLKIVSELIRILKIENYSYVNIKTPISGKSIMFTGGFQNKSRSELKSLAENFGAKIVSTLSKKVDFLVTGSTKPTIRKINEAKNLNINIKFSHVVVVAKGYKKVKSADIAKISEDKKN